jgi:hypothetical protein
MELSEVYTQKIAACIKSIKLMSSTPTKVLAKYEGRNFPDSNVSKSTVFGEVLSSSLSTATVDFMNESCDLPHHRDRRKPFEYAVDLILGWMIEDAVLGRIDDSGVTCVLSGHDRYREFLPPLKISSQADISIEVNGKDKLLEVFSDWKGTWRKQNHADLRDNKYKRLVEDSAYLLGIAPLTQEGFLFDFEHEPMAFEASFIPAYRKSGFTNHDIRDRLRPLDDILELVLRQN